MWDSNCGGDLRDWEYLTQTYDHEDKFEERAKMNELVPLPAENATTTAKDVDVLVSAQQSQTSLSSGHGPIDIIVASLVIHRSANTVYIPRQHVHYVLPGCTRPITAVLEPCGMAVNPVQPHEPQDQSYQWIDTHNQGSHNREHVHISSALETQDHLREHAMLYDVFVVEPKERSLQLHPKSSSTGTHVASIPFVGEKETAKAKGRMISQADHLLLDLHRHALPSRPSTPLSHYTQKPQGTDGSKTVLSGFLIDHHSTGADDDFIQQVCEKFNDSWGSDLDDKASIASDCNESRYDNRVAPWSKGDVPTTTEGAITAKQVWTNQNRGIHHSSVRALAKAADTPTAIGMAKSNNTTPSRHRCIEKMCLPLSAYNYFYRDESENIVRGMAGVDSPLPDPIKDFTQERQERLLHQHWYIDPFKKKRSHHKKHGKIDFQTLAEAVKSRWKDLSPEGRSFYRRVADADQAQYDLFKPPQERQHRCKQK